jgi:hypothetical protein
MMWFGQHSLSPHSRGSSVAALVHINSIIVEKPKQPVLQARRYGEGDCSRIPFFCRRREAALSVDQLHCCEC